MSAGTLTYPEAVRTSHVTVQMLYFGRLRELAGTAGPREFAAGTTVVAMLSELQGDGRIDGDLLRSSAVAVNREYARHDTLLKDGDEVAILPPVSGGRA